MAHIQVTIENQSSVDELQALVSAVDSGQVTVRELLDGAEDWTISVIE